MPMDCSPDTSLFLINDDRFRMESRVKRLKKKKLILRDQIAKLEDRLTPDIIA